jgi:N utilization substance protein B
MPSGRRSARRQAVFVLYQQDLLKLTPEAALQRLHAAEVDEYALVLVMGVARERSDIDSILQEHVSGWSVDRLGVLERSILRLAAFELLWRPDVPAAVAIDEAVALAKRFCSDEAGALVNGVLGSLIAAKDTRLDEAHDAKLLERKE